MEAAKKRIESDTMASWTAYLSILFLAGTVEPFRVHH